jgi:fructose-1-phosphate kinase PfkB-like protein
VEAESWSSLRKALDELMEGADWLILSGSLPPGVPLDGYVEVIDAAHREGVKVAVDTRDESLAAAVARGPELIKINAQESAAMLDVPVTSAQEAATAAKVLRSRSGQHASVVITRGTEGAIALEARCWQARSPARGPFPVGSGDSFLAGLVTGLDRGWEGRQALALALGAGAANAEQPGAGRLDRQRAESLAAEVEIAELPPP